MDTGCHSSAAAVVEGREAVIVVEALLIHVEGRGGGEAEMSQGQDSHNYSAAYLQILVWTEKSSTVFRGSVADEERR